VAEDSNQLTPEEIQWVKNGIADEKAKSRLALKVRNYLTFIILIVGSFTLFYDQLKATIQHFVKSM